MVIIFGSLLVWACTIITAASLCCTTQARVINAIVACGEGTNYNNHPVFNLKLGLKPSVGIPTAIIYFNVNCFWLQSPWNHIIATNGNIKVAKICVRTGNKSCDYIAL